MSEIITTPSPQAEGTDCWTRREILQQPETLRATQMLLARDEAAIAAFLAPLLAQPALRIVLTGAGTSAFIGEALAPWLSRLLNRNVEAIATTDIVSAPSLYLRADAPTLLVSFGRSGNSPESLVAVELADARIGSVHHLIVTCNGEGALAKRKGDNSQIVVLPEATHDRGYAMTSSFTAMLLAALSIFSGIGTMEARVERIAAATAAMLDKSEARTVSLAADGFERVVYLGSGPFSGLAREAALKLMELTDGALVTTFNSPLGFRHGPKTIITDRTLAIIFLSNDPLTRRYDLDLANELRKDGVCRAVLTVSAQPVEGDAITIGDAQFMADIDLLFPFIVPAQLLGVHAALALGLAPDQPNVTGTVSRVVQGVRIYAEFMTGTDLYLGVDGGGTKTEFVCIDAAGSIVARALTGTTYHLQVGLEGAAAFLEEGVRAICDQLAVTPDKFAFVFFGLPAFGEDAVVDPQLEQACGRILGHARFRCGNDMICGWAGSLACEDGINLVAGTGSIGYGERQGQAARAGGWGEVFSDEGSAYWIAIRGLTAFTKMSDGRLPKGPLHRHIVEKLALSDDLDLCARIMGEHGMSREEIAGLAPIVSAAASDGDAIAASILKEAASELASMARALRRALGFAAGETAALSWSGGVLAGEPIVRGQLERLLSESGDFRLIAPRHPPGYGAALYAAHLHKQRPA